MKVDFMIVGAQKCGTTTLFDILAAHPSIVGSVPKEPHYFSTTSDWRRNLPSYEKLFEVRPGARYLEASTTYTFYPFRKLRIWDDLFEYNPALKLVYLVRNPAERIVSAYMHSYERGYTDLGIEDAIVNEPFYVDITRYYTQISPYIQRFGRERVLILDFADLVERPEDLLETVAAFLEIDETGFPAGYDRMHSNASLGRTKTHHKYNDIPLPLRAFRKAMPSVWRRFTDDPGRHFREKPVLPRRSREMIVHLLELEIAALERLMDRDLGRWRTIEDGEPAPSSAASAPVAS